MTDVWLDDEQQRSWRAFIETQSDLVSALERDLETVGISLGDYRVLVILSESDGHQLRMCDLADRLQLSPSGLTRRLDGLVADGSVSRRRDPADGRVMLAVLTPSGLDRLTTIAPLHVASVRRRIFDHLDERQVHQLEVIFESIRAGLGAEQATGDGSTCVG